MKRLRVPGVIDVLFVDDGSQMQWLHGHPQVRRSGAPGAGVVHQLLGMAPAEGGSADDVSRRDPPDISHSPQPHDASDDDVRPDLRKLINFVTGLDAGPDLAATAHHWMSRTFGRDHEHASARSIGTGILLGSLTAMRGWAALPSSATWSTKTAVARSVRVPSVSIRRCKAEISAPFLTEALTPQTVIVFLVKRMLRHSADPQAAFLANGWDGGPAPRAVIDLLSGIWDAARERSEVEISQCARRQARHSLGLDYRRRDGAKLDSSPRLLPFGKGSARRSS